MKKRDNAPSPERICDDLRELKRMLPSVLADYRWAYSFAHSTTRRSGLGEGGRGGGHSDPTGSVATGRCPECEQSQPGFPLGLDVEKCTHNEVRDQKESVRAVVRETAKDIQGALVQIKAARARLKKHLGAKGRDFLNLPDPGQVTPKDKVTEAREAQQRRMGRGEGWGDG